jgi:urea carboxylase
MFKKVLIANRGAVACRIIRTLRRMKVGSVAVFSDADAGSLHVTQADEAVRIGPAPPAESYLNIRAVLAAATAAGAEAIHPGYGFLSESTAFAQACEAAAIVFIGPTVANLDAFGLKHRARALAKACGVPLAAGTELLADAESALNAARTIGYPVMLKATAGGGGIGMRVCESDEAVLAAYAAVPRLAAASFGDGGVFLEQFVPAARHVEVQIFGDGEGGVLALGERDCSLQRRNQKVIEETPAPHLPAATRAALIEAAVRLGRAARYRSAGTVEFLYDPGRDAFSFLEVNTRLQVEHGVTEQVTGIDLVEWMVRGAAGDYGFMAAGAPPARGASIQARLYAEDPGNDHRPSAGRLTEVAFPCGPRIETWVAAGAEVSAHYDPLIAKLIVTAADRPTAVRALQEALTEARLAGIETNLDWLRTVARAPAFVAGKVSTDMLAGIETRGATISVVSGGPATTVQDYPGRLGYWDVGVPPSGPMDTLAFRLGNRLLGNPESAAGLEFAAHGPTLVFNTESGACLTGADFGATLDDRPITPYAPFVAARGQTLKIGRVRGAGLRGYLLVAGGLDTPTFLDSRATFTLGGFGGHGGRAIAAGDILHILQAARTTERRLSPLARPPPLGRAWRIRVLTGPHAAPDFFTPHDLVMILGTDWQVHYNSSRTGVRLVGPKPHWARRDGGEAGLHPSNIHDNAYAIGALDFTGDMPIILGPDGPSLGGFVCPVVVIQADLWMTGQLAPGDTVRFVAVDEATARLAERDQEAFVRDLAPPRAVARGPARAPKDDPVLATIEAAGARPRVVYRRQGDRSLLVEYGPNVLDLELRLRVHALMLHLQALALPGVIDITPGIRSLQVHFDARVLGQGRLLEALVAAEDQLAGLDDFEIPSRIVHLPLSWKDPAIYQTIERYMQSVRDDAPWCPDNIEFIRRINGLDSIEDVRRIVFDARYLVMGLGDVYLGAPVATPLDPRHRLVTTKYNPARTWTPPNVVGIGGAYMCIYGMEGPGGYQLFGRTIQVWDTYRRARAFADGKPWLLRFFDQIRFYPVEHEELTAWRRDFPLGRREPVIEPTMLRLSDHRALLAANRPDIATFEARRRAAFDRERADWEQSGEFARVEALVAEPAPASEGTPSVAPPDGSELVEAPLGGSVWKMLVAPGDRLEKGATFAVIEAMKAECAVASPAAGLVTAVYARENHAISAGAPLIALEAV